MTIPELKKLLRNAGLEYCIKKVNGKVAIIHVLVEEDDYVTQC